MKKNKIILKKWKGLMDVRVGQDILLVSSVCNKFGLSFFIVPKSAHDLSLILHLRTTNSS